MVDECIGRNVSEFDIMESYGWKLYGQILQTETFGTEIYGQKFYGRRFMQNGLEFRL